VLWCLCMLVRGLALWVQVGSCPIKPLLVNKSFYTEVGLAQ
jgi:hypothetical protein